jgi:hypothetical protein
MSDSQHRPRGLALTAPSADVVRAVPQCRAGARRGLRHLSPASREVPPALAERPDTTRYEDAPPPCDAPHLTPRAAPPGIAGQPLAIRSWDDASRRCAILPGSASVVVAQSPCNSDYRYVACERRVASAKADAWSYLKRHNAPVIFSDSPVLSIRTDDDAEELRSLLAWLQQDDALRGRVRMQNTPVGPEEMGGLLDALTVVLGTSGVAAALSGSVSTWISQRRSDVKLTVTAPNGRSVDVDAKRVNARTLAADIERLLDVE